MVERNCVDIVWRLSPRADGNRSSAMKDLRHVRNSGIAMSFQKQRRCHNTADRSQISNMAQVTEKKCMQALTLFESSTPERLIAGTVRS